MGRLVDEASFDISQEGDGLQESGVLQTLRVQFLTQDHDGDFIRIKTGNDGWSVDTPEDMANILRQLAKAVRSIKTRVHESEEQP
jgi:hypothetical protein